MEEDADGGGGEWQQEYMRGLQERDAREKKDEAIYRDFFALAQKYVRAQRGGGGGGGDAGGQTNEATATKQTFANDAKLHAAQEELSMLRISAANDRAAVDHMKAECRLAETRLATRTEETQENKKSLQAVHDELLATQLELNVADDTIASLKKENQQLIDRWMARVGVEVERLNQSNESRRLSSKES